MAEMEDKINSILSDPKMMQQIMSMAQALGAGQPEAEGPKETKSSPPPFPDIDMATMQRMADPDELAAVVTFLCTEDASWVTGQTLMVSGGGTVN